MTLNLSIIYISSDICLEVFVFGRNWINKLVYFTLLCAAQPSQFHQTPTAYQQELQARRFNELHSGIQSFPARTFKGLSITWWEVPGTLGQTKMTGLAGQKWLIVTSEWLFLGKELERDVLKLHNQKIMEKAISMCEVIAFYDSLQLVFWKCWKTTSHTTRPACQLTRPSVGWPGSWRIQYPRGSRTALRPHSEIRLIVSAV